MIPFKKLVEEIWEFSAKLKEAQAECHKVRTEGDENSDRECFSQYFEMTQAWSKLDDAVESLLPYTRKL